MTHTYTHFNRVTFTLLVENTSTSFTAFIYKEYPIATFISFLGSMVASSAFRGTKQFRSDSVTLHIYGELKDDIYLDLGF
jgi:hypothetical protein